MKFEKRKYEELAVKAVKADLRNHRRVLAVAPTGSGKTVIAAMAIKSTRRWKRVLWLAHRYELVDQAYETLRALGVPVAIMMAQEENMRGLDRADCTARVQVASVQTIASRGVPYDVDLIVFDEAHRVMADTYQDIAKSCVGVEVLGLTATPCRMDGRGLGEYFAHMRVMAKPSELQSSGYLASPRVFGAPQDVVQSLVKLKKVRKAGGDFTSSSLSAAVSTKALVGKVVSETLRLAPDVPKVVFACSVAHSRKLAKGFVKAGVKAAHLDGETPAQEREGILAQLELGKLEVVCNVDVLSEGWDLPSLGAVVVARPTMSKARWLQMVGRGMRVHGDARPLVIDHGANIQRLDVFPGEDIEWTLDDGVADAGDSVARLLICECGAALERGETVCGECGAELEASKSPREAKEELEAELEEISRARMAELRGRVEALAKEKGAGGDWVDTVMGLVSGFR